ncbi:dipeptide/oligopeptide/nickel ABC transporter ATP-binding protein [Synergistales bacterium]|nr:dipeptide/oligopeptide/nickel ABC transporter ATP-binding protein [Synergistales bacterium]
MNDKNKLLEIERLSVRYIVNNVVVEAVTDLSLDVEEGEYVGLVGETGAGKTTTALAAMGLIPDPPGKITSGFIRFEGEDLLRKTPKQMRTIRGSSISMIFQDPMTSLNPVINIGDQIMEVILLHNKISKGEATLKAQKMLEMVGISANRYPEFPHQFSGGMKQRVMIACALACNPKLLIADEPTTALDVTIQAQILELIENLKKEFNTAMLMITHDLGVVSEVCDRVAVMYAGNIVEQGSVSAVYQNPAHPYTVGLFNSLPDLDEDTERLKPIPGMMPDPSNLPKGCSFAPRCSFCSRQCEEEQPDTVEAEPGHKIACFNFRRLLTALEGR